MGNGALAENLKEDDKTVIWRPHEEKYRTSEWYTGSGQITTADEGLSFEVTAVYQLKSEVKVVKDIFAISNHTLANIYRPRSRCIAVVESNRCRVIRREDRRLFPSPRNSLRIDGHTGMGK